MKDRIKKILSDSRDINSPNHFASKRAIFASAVGTFAIALTTAIAISNHSDTETEPEEQLSQQTDTIDDKPTDIALSPQNGAYTTKQLSARDKYNRQYSTFLKSRLGTDYANHTYKAPDPRLASRYHYNAGSASPVSKSYWNVERLFNYPQALKNGLQKLLNMPADAAFDKAVAIESGGRQFDASGNVVRSSANAIGIAQVLPSTARVIAPRCTGSALDERRFYYDADYNESLGRCYFREQFNTYGNTVMAALAYNTGPGNLDRHINRVGDPTRGEINLVDFIRTIPYSETRQYTLHMMKKGGLIDPNDVGSDVFSSKPMVTGDMNFTSLGTYNRNQTGSSSYQRQFNKFSWGSPSRQKQSTTPKGPQYLTGDSPTLIYLEAK